MLQLNYQINNCKYYHKIIIILNVFLKIIKILKIKIVMLVIKVFKLQNMNIKEIQKQLINKFNQIQLNKLDIKSKNNLYLKEI